MASEPLWFTSDRVQSTDNDLFHLLSPAQIVRHRAKAAQPPDCVVVPVMGQSRTGALEPTWATRVSM